MNAPVDPRTTRALVAVARMVLIEVERAGLMRDDRPELCLSTVERWCEGEATVVEVMDALDQVATATWQRGEGNDAAAIVMWVCRVNGRDDAAEAVLRRATALLERLGEAPDAAKHRVQKVFSEG